METLQISSFVHISNENESHSFLIPLLPPPPHTAFWSSSSVLRLARSFARSPRLVRRSLLAARCSSLSLPQKKKKKAKRKPLPPPTATPTTTTTLPKAKPLKTTGRQSNALNPALPLQLSVLFRHRRQGLHSGAGLCPRGGSQESRPGRQGGAR